MENTLITLLALALEKSCVKYNDCDDCVMKDICKIYCGDMQNTPEYKNINEIINSIKLKIKELPKNSTSFR